MYIDLAEKEILQKNIIHVFISIYSTLSVCNLLFFQPESIAIKVIGRCRPFTQEETKKGPKVGVSVSGDKVTVHGGKVGLTCIHISDWFV